MSDRTKRSLWGLLIAAVVGFSVLSYILGYERYQAAVPLVATVLQVTEETDSEGDTYHDALVEYEVDGAVYQSVIKRVGGSLQVSDRVRIRYDPQKPGIVRRRPSMPGTFLPCLMFVVILRANYLAADRRVKAAEDPLVMPFVDPRGQ